MAQFYTVLTQTGQAKMANALALGTMIEITQLAVGDGGGSLPSPDSSRETLINEVRRASINRLDVDPDNPSWLVVEQVLPPEEGGWTIREVGVIDADGDLIGYGNYPETYKPTLDEGSGRTQTIRMVLEVSDTAAVTLKVDPSVVLATRECVDQERAEHEASRAHPAATESLQGMIKRASQTKALAGDDNADAMTALRVFEQVAQWGIGATAFEDDVDLDVPKHTSGCGFRFVANATNGPTASFDGFVIEFGSSATSQAVQIAATHTSNGELYYRNLGTPWRKAFSDQNLVAATTSVPGLVEKATEEEAKGGWSDKFPDANGVIKTINQFGIGLEYQPLRTFSGPEDYALRAGECRFVRSSSFGAPGSIHFMYQVIGKRDVSGGYSAIAIELGTSEAGQYGGMYYARVPGRTTAPEWVKVATVNDLMSGLIGLSSTVPQAPNATNVDEALSAVGALAGTGSQNLAVFDTAGVTSWAVPEVLKNGIRKAWVTVQGAGGGGGGKGTDAAGGGASAGAAALKMVDLSGITSVDVTVGAGGAGGASSNHGSPGGMSSFGPYVSAAGGNGGYSYTRGDARPGVDPGTSGDINLSGAGGHYGNYFGGQGGGSLFGGGGAGGNTGYPGYTGAGGGGAENDTGGVGGDGIVTIQW